MSQRILKVNELLAQQLGQLINERVEFPTGCLVTITRAETASDLSQVRVYFSVLPENQKAAALKTLKKEAYNLHQFLNKKISWRRIPKLVFLFDDSEIKFQAIDQLLDGLNK